MKTSFQRSLCLVLAIVFYSVSTQAALIATDQAVAGAARSKVQSQLVQLGVNPAAAGERVAALSDEEALQLAERLDTLPAGGDGVGLVLIVLLVVLLVLLLDRRHR